MLLTLVAEHTLREHGWIVVAGFALGSLLFLAAIMSLRSE